MTIQALKAFVRPHNADGAEPRTWSYLQSAVAGVLLALVFVPYPWSFLAPLPLAWIFALIAASRSPKAAFWTGFAAGTGFFALHLLWLPVSFSDLFGPVIIPPLLLLPPLLGVFWGLTAGLSRVTGRYTLFMLPFAWIVTEYLRSLGIFGFTWGTLGYAFLPTPIIQVADLGGVLLVSLLVALSAAALAALLRHVYWPTFGVALLLSAAMVYGLTRPAPPVADRNVLLVQGSVNPLDKAETRSTDELELYQTLSERGLAESARPVDLVVWPEGASPLPVDSPWLQSALNQLAVPAIIGAPAFERGYQNSAYAFDGEVTSRYSKVKLVPFGERFPLRETLSFLYDPLFAAIGLPGLVSVLPGDGYPVLQAGDITAATYICYESTFSQVARTQVRSGANLLVNISNDAWFGRTQGAEQHFQMGRVRAIETRRYLARAGNDGISAVIDPLGRVLQRFPRGARDAFEARVGLSEVLTPYLRYGDWVVGVSLLVSITLLVLAAAGRLNARADVNRENVNSA